jgi:hypothetical protein
MIYIFCMEVVHFAVQLALILDIFFKGGTQDRANEWFHMGAAGAVNGVLIAFLCFNAVSIFMIGQLLWFHIGLQRDNLTTYQYIVKDHQKRRERAHLEELLQGKRTVALAKARQENQPMYVMELRLGGWCRKMGCPAFDPLPMPLPEPEPDVEANGFGAALGKVRAPQESSNTGTQSTNGDHGKDNAEAPHKHHHRRHSKKHHNKKDDSNSSSSPMSDPDSHPALDTQDSPSSSKHHKRVPKRSSSLSAKEQMIATLLQEKNRPSVPRSHSTSASDTVTDVSFEPGTIQRTPSMTSAVTIDTNQAILPTPIYYSAATDTNVELPVFASAASREGVQNAQRGEPSSTGDDTTATPSQQSS